MKIGRREGSSRCDEGDKGGSNCWRGSNGSKRMLEQDEQIKVSSDGHWRTQVRASGAGRPH